MPKIIFSILLLIAGAGYGDFMTFNNVSDRTIGLRIESFGYKPLTTSLSPKESVVIRDFRPGWTLEVDQQNGVVTRYANCFPRVREDGNRALNGCYGYLIAVDNEGLFPVPAKFKFHDLDAKKADLKQFDIAHGTASLAVDAVKTGGTAIDGPTTILTSPTLFVPCGD